MISRLILLDVMMPMMDGFETASLIRQRERSRTTPSSSSPPSAEAKHIFRGYDVGAVDYLTKPVVPEILRSKVAVFVELARKNALLQHRRAARRRTSSGRSNAQLQLRR
jgi:CheY-like chemotaxis protein